MRRLPLSVTRSSRAVGLRSKRPAGNLHIDWVIPCRYVEVHGNLATMIGAGIDTYWVETFPATIRVVVAVRLLATADALEQGEPHTITNRIRDPRGAVVSEVSDPLTFQGKSARPERLAGIALPIVVHFEATEEGTYTLEHAVDQSSDRLPIHVALGRPDSH
jgi:hypothetical protein